MLIRAMLFALAPLTLALPATAQEAIALGVRLAFDDCLGYVRDGIEPFEGLETSDLTVQEIAWRESIGLFLPGLMIQNRAYLGTWGTEDRSRICVIFGGDSPPDAQILDIRFEDLLAQANLRAKTEGLVPDIQQNDGDVAAYRWSEPGVAPDKGLTVSMVMVVSEGLAEVSYIHVSMALPDLIN